MSRIGRKEMPVPKGVEVKVADGVVRVKGPKGELSKPIHAAVSVTLADGQVRVARSSDEKFHKSLHGMLRNEIQNMLVGVTQGYERVLEITGVGYRAQCRGGACSQSGLHPPDRLSASDRIDASVESRRRDDPRRGQVPGRTDRGEDPRHAQAEPYKGKGSSTPANGSSVKKARPARRRLSMNGHLRRCRCAPVLTHTNPYIAPVLARLASGHS
jgi:large subunit ribosomal protein L6